MTRPALLRCVFVVLVLSLTGALTGNLPVLASEPQWVEVRSPNFTVSTDAGEKRGREVAMRFEQMRAVFGTLMTKSKVSLPVPLQIVAFRNTKEMRQVAPIFKGKPTELAGLFQGGADRSFIMLDMSTENPWSVVFHEYAHQLLNGNLQVEPDPWFEEGFAEYFSSIEVDDKEALVGKIPPEDYLILQQVGLLKIADLFKVRQYSETYNESGNRRTSFYSESGMLMHYIFDNQLMPKVSDYFDLKMNKHVPVEDAMQRAFGMSAAQFDKVLHGYISDRRYRYYKMAAPSKIPADKFSARPLTIADANATLADIHLHSPDYQDKAIAEFQEILKTDANNASACRGLGYAYMQKHDFEQAAGYFKRASEADSKDPRVHYYNALLMTRQDGFSRESDLPLMTKELETSIGLDPDFADSYALLAFAQMNSGDSAQGVASMLKALSINPRNESYRFNLASLYLANREPDKAIAVLKSMENTANPELASRVAAELASAQEFQSMKDSGMASGSNLVFSHRVDDSSTNDSSTSHEGHTTEESTPVPAKPEIKWGPATFLQGILSSVDCSSDPAAVLTVASGAKSLKLKVADKRRVVLIGADEFSCAWSKKKVAVNYRQSDSGETNVISLEIQ